jgi:hypothetical protein
MAAAPTAAPPKKVRRVRECTGEPQKFMRVIDEVLLEERTIGDRQ